MVFPVPTFALSYVATADTVTISPGATPLNAPAVTAAVVFPSYTLDDVIDGAAIVNALFSSYPSLYLGL